MKKLMDNNDFLKKKRVFNFSESQHTEAFYCKLYAKQLSSSEKKEVK